MWHHRRGVASRRLVRRRGGICGCPSAGIGGGLVSMAAGGGIGVHLHPAADWLIQCICGFGLIPSAG